MPNLPWIRNNSAHEWSQNDSLQPWQMTRGSTNFCFLDFFSGYNSIKGTLSKKGPLHCNPYTSCGMSFCPWGFSWIEVASLLPFLIPCHTLKDFISNALTTALCLSWASSVLVVFQFCIGWWFLDYPGFSAKGFTVIEPPSLKLNNWRRWRFEENGWRWFDFTSSNVLGFLLQCDQGCQKTHYPACW